MKTDDFDYDLPQELIAQTPLNNRSESRLLVYSRENDKIKHQLFKEIFSFFGSKDLLIFNDTRVIPARLFGHKKTGGKVELLLIRELEENCWEAMIKTSKKVNEGMMFFLEGEMKATVVERLDDTIIIKLEAKEDVREAIESWGKIPLPPYIKRDVIDSDKERYQTVYAKSDGAVAAPTAGLHFTDEILDEIRSTGADIEMITLHVGPGTFQPVRVDDVEQHKMHEEFFQISEEVALKVNRVKENGGRVIAVGTTVVRALESAAKGGKLLPKEGWTDIFIHPGCKLNIIDALITNFHLPKSTLLMLVSAFAGTDKLKKIYKEAIWERYRFFSYGDAMIII